MKNTKIIDCLPVTAFAVASAAAVLMHLFGTFDGAVLVSIVLFALGALLILALHIWTPQLDPLNCFVSEYSLEWPFGTIMKIAFFVMAVGSFNLCFLLGRSGMSWGMELVVFIAGVFVAGMGIFSQKSSKIDAVQNTDIEGNIHSICAGCSFTLAGASMLIYACNPFPDAVLSLKWTPAVGLCQFEITVVAVLIQIIFGLRKVKVVAKVTGIPTGTLFRNEFERRFRGKERASYRSASGTALSNAELDPPKQAAEESGTITRVTLENGDVELLKQANQGLGLTERILIFLFLEWLITLSAFLLKTNL